MLGRSRIASTHFVAPGVFCIFEPHLNSGSTGSVEARTGGSGIPAFASYVHNVNFAADNISRYWRSPACMDKKVGGAMLPRARLNKIKSTEGGGVAGLALEEDGPDGPKHLHSYVATVVNDFQASFKPEQYLAHNQNQWGELHLFLSAGRPLPKTMPYPFADALSLLKVEAPDLLAEPSKPPAVAAGSGAAAAAVAAATAAATGPTTAFGRELAGVKLTEREPHVGKVVLGIVHDLSGSSGASVDTPLMEAGVDSLAATELSNRLAKLTELTLPFTLLFEYPTSRAVSGYILGNAGLVDAPEASACAAVPSAATGGEGSTRPDVVIANAVGQSPGAIKTGRRLAKMVEACGDAVGLVPLARWDLERLVNDPVTQVRASPRSAAPLPPSMSFSHPRSCHADDPGDAAHVLSARFQGERLQRVAGASSPPISPSTPTPSHDLR